MEQSRQRPVSWWHLTMLALAMSCLLSAWAVAGEVRILTVKKGDTLARLCRQVYKAYSPAIVAQVKAANPGLDRPDRIKVGQQLRFPDLAATATSAPAAATKPSSTEGKAEPAPAHGTTAAAAASQPPAATPAPAKSAEGAGDTLAATLTKEIAPAEALLPAGTRLVAGWQPGSGQPVGAVEMAQGRSWLIHQGDTVAYDAERERPLFSGDTLITGDKGMLRCRLEDKSVFSLAGQSKLILDKTVYDPAKDRRESVLQLLFGKARFMVNKLKGGYQGDFEVRTPTAICGVRGSDFVIGVVPAGEAQVSQQGWRSWLTDLLAVPEARAVAGLPLSTLAMTGANTTVGFSGLVGASQTLSAFSLSVAPTGGAAIGALGVSPALAGSVLGTIGPLSAVTAMPAGLD